MNHFTDADLRRWSDEGPGLDRDHVVAHVAACAECAARYAEALRTRPLDADLAADAADFVAAGYRAGGATGSRWTRRWSVIGGLAAAAALVAAAVVPRLMHTEETPRFRGAEVHALAPTGPVTGRPEFAWSSAIEAPRFRLEIGDAAGIVYTTDSSGSPVRAPEALQQILKPGTEYWWRVTALDASGQALQASRRQTFSITPPQ